MSLFGRIQEVEDSGQSAALVTVVRVTGSTPREAGARMLVLADGSIEGTVGGGQIEHAAIQAAREVIQSKRPRFVEHQLTQELGMCCGGAVALFIEPLVGAPPLILFGAGHVGTALTRMATHAGFAVHVVDARDELLTRERLPEARALYPDLDDPALPFSPETFVMIATHDHALDQRLLEKSLKKTFCWIGMIGSRRKARLARERLAHKDFSPDMIDRLRSPVGLAIGAQTPEEIAVSILSELIARRHGAPLTATPALEQKEGVPR